MFAVVPILVIALAPGRSPPEVAGLGTIVPGSIVQLGPLKYRLTLEDAFGIDGKWPSSKRIDVVLFGELPEIVCDRRIVYVSGTTTANEVAASVVNAVPDRYDRCFDLQCHRAAYDACQSAIVYR